jgi:hypothetical protein
MPTAIQSAGPKLPTPIPTPSQNAAAQFSESPSDVEDAFASETQQVAQSAAALAEAPCARLREALDREPRAVSSLRAYATTLRRMSEKDQVLSQSRSLHFLKQMDDSLSDLERQLVRCGLPPS